MRRRYDIDKKIEFVHGFLEELDQAL